MPSTHIKAQQFASAVRAFLVRWKVAHPGLTFNLYPWAMAHTPAHAYIYTKVQKGSICGLRVCTALPNTGHALL